MAHGITKALFVFAMLLVADFAAAQTAPRGYIAALKATGQHTQMVKMIESNALYKGLLSNFNGAFTVFAPTDAAFTSASQKYGITPEAAMKNQALLMAMLQYHVVPGKPVWGSTLRSGKRTLKTMYKGMSLTITNGKDKVTGKDVTWVNSAAAGVRVNKFNQLVGSTVTGQTIGLIHSINGVLLFDKDPAKVLATK